MSNPESTRATRLTPEDIENLRAQFTNPRDVEPPVDTPVPVETPAPTPEASARVVLSVRSSAPIFDPRVSATPSVLDLTPTLQDSETAEPTPDPTDPTDPSLPRFSIRDVLSTLHTVAWTDRSPRTRRLGAAAASVVVATAGLTATGNTVSYLYAQAHRVLAGTPAEGMLFRPPSCTDAVIYVDYMAAGPMAQKMNVITDPSEQAKRLKDPTFKPTSVKTGYSTDAAEDKLPLLPAEPFTSTDRQARRLPVAGYGEPTDQGLRPGRLALAMCVTGDPTKPFITPGEDAASVRVDASRISFVALPSTGDNASKINIGYEKLPYNRLLTSSQARSQFPAGELERQETVLMPPKSGTTTPDPNAFNPAIINKFKVEALAEFDNPTSPCGEEFSRLAQEAVRTYIQTASGKKFTPQYTGSFVGPSQSARNALSILPEAQRTTDEVMFPHITSTCNAMRNAS